MTFRYPGGKAKLKKEIFSKLQAVYSDQIEYREPFFGGGSIGLYFLELNSNIKKIWINDFDIGISSLWTSIIRYPEELQKQILNFKPSVSAFDDFKQELLSTNSIEEKEIVSFGFKKLAIHQISYSGLGTKSGGPLGGRDQKSNYKIDCRWSPNYICKKIDKINSLFSKFSIKNDACTNLDFSSLIKEEDNSIVYVDPPYYAKGNDLYQCGFKNEDHIRLSNDLKQTKNKWVLSYDDCEEIKNLYNWANIEEINEVNYTITATKDKISGQRKSRIKNELVITK